MKISRTIFIICVSLVIYATNALGGDTLPQAPSGQRSGPPPEAYTACSAKKVGDTASFVNPRGETVTGTCAQEGSQLVLRPDHPKGQSGGQHHGPPAEAYAACKAKKVGDTASFVNPRGETVTGTCAQEGSQLVLRPDHPKTQSGDSTMNTTDH